MMFEFSEDFDEEAEDFLSIPLDNQWSQNDKQLGNRDENSNTNNVNSSMKNDATFEGFDDEDEEMILSVVENVDSSFKKTKYESTIGDTSSLCSENQDASTTLEKPSISTFVKNKCVQERLDSFVRCNPVRSPHNTSKHKLNTIIDPSPSPTKSLKLEYERKFPGPAGLILKKSRDSLSNNELNCTGLNQLNVSVTDDILTDNNNWLELVKEVNDKSSEQSKIMNEFTVVALKRTNILKQISRKIPLFAAVIFHLDSTTSDPSVLLKDPTGEIRGTLHRDLWDQYSHLLVVGSALLLRHVSMLSFANSRRLYLNITTNNVDTIYSCKTGDESVLITRVTPSTALDSLLIKPSSKAETVVKTTQPNGVDHSMISINDEQVGKQNRPSSSSKSGLIFSTLSSINNELEGIDVDSLFADF